MTPARLGLTLVRSFLGNRCLMMASALCYATVLSLVPLLAVAFSLAKGFGVYDAPYLREALLRLTAEKADIVDAVLGYIQNTNVRALGFIGVAMLFITSAGLISTVEEACNVIWRAPGNRGAWSRLTNYLTVILVCPLFILAAFSVTATFQNAQVVHWLGEIELVNKAFTLGLKAVPTLMVCVSLFVLYKFLPNVEVRALPAAAGALAAGIGWQLAQAAYIRYQIGVTGYNAIYGSFAQIPLLLVWLYISWLIVLAGAELAHAIQSAPSEAARAAGAAYSLADRRGVALLAALMLTEKAETAGGPLLAEDAAQAGGLPPLVVEEELARLARIGIAARVEGGGYVLLAAPDRITVGELLTGWENLRGDGPIPDLDGRYPVLARLRKGMETACREVDGRTLRELYETLPQERDSGDGGGSGQEAPAPTGWRRFL
ncbi:YhjD/YihY/BrkB family envelope integrity protein [Fundidesulfovibrio agrisoli]|uniref:YhjD/YihY/BrkB family envelope integrity protein n=1 Tax=Fundidesulfovibrio agrisoli TaxID=2922717 RepID=UPI001FABE2F1|nr:YhjD/YihY/BrkB family envelope integrity protein [Fundidesulfovibrio agrisoli]